MEKGIAGLLILFVAIFLIFFVLLIFGVAGNYSAIKEKSGDTWGIASFFVAVGYTVGQWFVLGNFLIWTLIFFSVQGVFLFTYYMIGKFIFVHVPQFQKQFEWLKQRLSI